MEMRGRTRGWDERFGIAIVARPGESFRVELGVHLPLMSFDGEAVSAERIAATVDASVECGFAAVSANDHFVYQTPWLDGPTALASVIERSAGLDLATTASLATLRGPVPLAKQLAAIDILSGGRLTAALGPGSSARDYEIIGLPFEQRWSRFDEAVIATRALLHGHRPPPGLAHYSLPSDTVLEPRSPREVPLWIGSWGSNAGLRRVARLGDGWLASAYNTTPAQFRTAAKPPQRVVGDQRAAIDSVPERTRHYVDLDR